MSTIGQTQLQQHGYQEVVLYWAVKLKSGEWVGDETLRLVQLQGQEKVGDLFQFQLSLRGNTDASGSTLTFDALLGQPITIGIVYPKLGSTPQDFKAALAGSSVPGMVLRSGIVASMAMEQPGSYQLVMRPSLWQLTLTNGYQIYPQLSLRDVIAKVLKQFGITYSMIGITGSSNPALTRVQDWFQAGETALAFIQRIIRKAHIFFYYQHQPWVDEVIFSNSTDYPWALPEQPKLRYTYSHLPAQHEDDVVTHYHYQQHMVSSSVAATQTRQQAAWEADTVANTQSYQGKSDTAEGTLPFYVYKIYQYGCSDQEAQHEADTQQQMINASATEFSGGSQSPALQAGYKFSLADQQGESHTPNPIQPSLAGQTFVITEVSHQVSIDGQYQNTFKATEPQGLITVFSIQETHQGSVLATVVDHGGGGSAVSAGEWKYYAPAVFDLELQQCRDRNSADSVLQAKGVFVQFSVQGTQSEPCWVKLAAHMQNIPEVGATVVVTRANDDSELPEIQSIVQNNGTKVVTPSGWTASTHVGSQYSTQYGDSQSIRFGKLSQVCLSEAIGIVQEAYDSGQYRDSSYSQGASFSYATAEEGKQGLLSRSKSWGCTYSEHYGQKSWSHSEIDSSYSEQLMVDTESHSTIQNKSLSYSTIGETEQHSEILKDTHSYSTVKGLSYSESTLGSVESKSTIKEDNIQDSLIKGDSISTHQVDGLSDSTQTMNQVSSSMTASTQSSTSAIGTTTSANVIGSATQGTVTGVSMTSSAIGLTYSANVVGSSTAVNTTGVSVSETTVGSSVATNITGASVNTSVVGASTNTNVIGSSTDVGVTGTSTRVSVVGESTQVNVTGVSNDVSVVTSSNSVSVKDTIAVVDVVASGVRFQTSPDLVKTEIIGTEISLLSAIKLIM